jgi:hypothetical protein
MPKTKAGSTEDTPDLDYIETLAMTVLSKKSWQKQPATYLVEWYI